MNDPYQYAQLQQPYQQPYPPQPTYVVVQPSTSNGMGIASFSIAMVGMFLSLLPIVGLIDWLLLPLGALFGLLGLFKHGKSKGLAIAGLILNVLGLLIMGVLGVAFLALVAANGGQTH